MYLKGPSKVLVHLKVSCTVLTRQILNASEVITVILLQLIVCSGDEQKQ